MKPFSRSRVAVLLALLCTAAVVSLFPQTVAPVIARLAPTATGESQRYELAADSVIDGDTLTVLNGKRTLEIDLCGIKAADQAEAVASEAALRRLIAPGRDTRITLVFADAKLQNRLVAEAFLPTDNLDKEIHLNSQMLLEGMAIIDPQSINACPNGSRLQVAEDEAKQQAIGIWSSPAAEKS